MEEPIIETYDEFGMSGVFVFTVRDFEVYYAEIEDVRWENSYIILKRPLMLKENSQGERRFGFFVIPYVPNVVCNQVAIMLKDVDKIYFTSKTKGMLSDLEVNFESGKD